jgi:DNA-binding SARP family transcriptional activator
VRSVVGDSITSLGEGWTSNGLVMTLQGNEKLAVSGLNTGQGVYPHRSEGETTALFAKPDCGPVDERIERPSVDDLLDRAAKRRICVVIGAAGWGKTTAVATWSRGRPSAWLRYEDHEGDPDRLLRGLFHALRAHVGFPGTAPGDTDQVESSVAALCAWLRSSLSNNLVLVLDDLHGLPSGGDAALVVEGLCQRAPEQLHLILISRRELPFSLQRLRGRGVVTEIHAPDLAFGVSDIDALLRQTVGEDPPSLAKHVWQRTGGWPTVVHSAVELLRTVPIDQRVDALARLCQPGQRLHGYLAEEVIGTAPEWVQQQLRRLAILGEVSFPTEITRGLSPPTSALAELSRQGLVLRTSRASYALMPPLRELFEQEAASSPAEWKALHVTAANECIEQGAPAKAIHHLLAAEDHAACAALLADQGSVMVEHGDINAVLQATELPDKYLDDPRIQQVLGQAQQVRGHWAQALQHLKRTDPDPDELKPALAWRMGVIAFARGEFEEVHALIRRTRLDRENTLDETRVLALAASTHRMRGDLMGLRKMALRTRTAAQQCGEPRAWSAAHHVLALLAAAQGDWRQANAHCLEAISNAEQCQDLLQLTWTQAFRAFHQFEAGASRHALADAETALSLAQRCSNPFFIAHALTTRGRARERLGMLVAAVDDFTTAIDLFQRIGSRFLAWPLGGLGDLYRTRGQLVRARAAYEEALTFAEPHHDVFGLSSALMGLARVTAADDLNSSVKFADRAVELNEELRKVPALLTRGWVELMAGDQPAASAYANRAIVAARQSRHDPGLAEAITLSVLASPNPAADAASLQEAIGIWHEIGCRLEEAATRLVAARIDASVPDLDDAYQAEQTLRNHGIALKSRRAAGPLAVLARSAPAVSIQTLGVFRVLRYGAPIPHNAWKSKKARELLKILVARRRPTIRDQLMALLWPEVTPAVASNRLSVLISTVRDVLQHHPMGEPPLTVTADGALSFNPTQVHIDVEDFLSQATTALAADRIGAPDAISLLATAVAAHTGGFLEDDPYQEWAAELAEEVQTTYIALLRALTRRLREAGDTDEVVRYTLRLLQQDRYDEEAHLSLITVLLEARRIGQAHRHYQYYVHRMNEIGIPPRPMPNVEISGAQR